MLNNSRPCLFQLQYNQLTASPFFAPPQRAVEEALDPSKEQIMMLNNGCLCCTVRDDLVDMLNTLVRSGSGLGHAAVLCYHLFAASACHSPVDLLNMLVRGAAVAGWLGQHCSAAGRQPSNLH